MILMLNHEGRGGGGGGGGIKMLQQDIVVSKG